MKRISPLLLILFAPMAMLYPIWSSPVSAGEDDLVYYYPLRKMAGDQLRQGRLPLQNPLEATGMPLMADPQSALMYPPTWLFGVMEPKTAYSLSVFLAFSLAGGGAYLYLRRLGLIRQAALFGAVAFMFCGFMVGHRVHLSVIHAAAYLPWGLWCIERLRNVRDAAGQEPRRADTTARAGAPLAWVGAFVAMVPTAYLAITAGHWPTLIHVGLIWLVYLLFRGRPLLRSAAVAAAATVLAAALASPQIDLTAGLLAQTTRQRIGYATFGENSFFPPAAVLALFPFLMGSRTPNFFSQTYWGPWHLCEMLGYAGLVTLVLAGAAVRTMFRRKNRPAPAGGPPESALWPPEGESIEPMRRLVRMWTFLAIGGGLWMLGYYLPSYKLIHMLPVLGLVRCPGRMVVLVDLALAALAAIAVHTHILNHAAPSPTAQSLKRGLESLSRVALPAAMLATLTLVAAAGLMLRPIWPDVMPFFAGGAEQMVQAVWPPGPAVLVPLGLMILTALAVRFWARRPRPRTGLLVATLLLDLFFITRFVDVPARDGVTPDPAVSPAARWLRQNAPDVQSYRIWGISQAYHYRPAELLLPKTCEAMGLATIANYGPFQSPAHAHLFGFEIFGSNRDAFRLIRQNYLLSLYGVRFILTDDPDCRNLIESVVVPKEPPPPEGPNLLLRRWSARRVLWRTTTGGGQEDGMVLRTPFLWSRAIAEQELSLQDGQVYRISLDVRGPEGGAANFLRVGVIHGLADGSDAAPGELGLTIPAEQIGPDWRHFEWVLRMPEEESKPAAATLLRIFTMSERPIEVRNLALRQSHQDGLVMRGDALGAGEPAYRRRAICAAVDPNLPPVAVYENRLWRPIANQPWPKAASEMIETLKWRPREVIDRADFRPPSVAITIDARPWKWFWMVSTPALGAWMAGAGIFVYLQRRQRVMRVHRPRTL